MSHHDFMGENGRSRPGGSLSHPYLLQAGGHKPRDILSRHEMAFCTVCIFRSFSFLFAGLILHRETYTSHSPNLKSTIRTPNIRQMRQREELWTTVSSRDRCLSCEWTHSQEEKGNSGHGHSHHPRGAGQVAVGLRLGIQLVHPEVKAASGQRHISTAGHLLRALSKTLSALFLGSWYDQGLSPPLSILISSVAGRKAHWLGEWALA